MAASTFMPDVTVQLGLGDGFGTPLASIVWTDASAYVEAQFLIDIFRGRSDEVSDVTPSTLSVTFDNKDGRFTPGYAAGAYYPNIKLGTPIRVSAVWTLPAGTTYRRFTGYVTDWGIEWPDPSAAMSTVTVTATSRMARLGRSAEMRSVLEEEVFIDDPFAYYPLGDPEGSTSAANVSAASTTPLTVQQEGIGGTLTFGSGVGPATDNLSAIIATPTGTNTGKYLRSVSSPTTGSGDLDLALECWFVTTLDGGLVQLATPDFSAIMSLTIFAGGPTLRAVTDFGAFSPGGLTGVATVNDGLLHHAVLKVAVDGVGGWSRTLLLDGQVDASDSGVGAPVSFPEFGLIHVAATNPTTPSPNMFSGTLAHAAVYNTAVSNARFLEHYEAGITGFEGETSDERIGRFAAYAGVPSAEVSTEAGNTESMSFQDTTGRAPVEAMFDVVHTENGLLFDAGDGTLTFQARDHRFGASSSITLNAATHQIEGDLQPKLDDQGLTNDVTATQPNGVSVRVVNQSSIDDHGTYRDSVEVFTTNALEVASYAELLTTTYADPKVRVANASVNLIVQPSATVTSLLALELGDLVTFTNLPTQAPSSTMTFFIEGIKESIGFAPGETWVMTFNLSPGDIPGDMWILGTSALDTTTVLAY